MGQGFIPHQTLESQIPQSAGASAFIHWPDFGILQSIGTGSFSGGLTTEQELNFTPDFVLFSRGCLLIRRLAGSGLTVAQIQDQAQTYHSDQTDLRTLGLKRLVRGHWSLYHKGLGDLNSGRPELA